MYFGVESPWPETGRTRSERNCADNTTTSNILSEQFSGQFHTLRLCFHAVGRQVFVSLDPDQEGKRNETDERCQLGSSSVLADPGIVKSV
eukprot:5370037-Pyramimonas_sp.AAC.1